MCTDSAQTTIENTDKKKTNNRLHSMPEDDVVGDKVKNLAIGQPKKEVVDVPAKNEAKLPPPNEGSKKSNAECLTDETSREVERFKWAITCMIDCQIQSRETKPKKNSKQSVFWLQSCIFIIFHIVQA